MNVEEKINDCEFNLKQIIHFEPDPYYVEIFFKDYLISINKFYAEIFEEVNRDFGLFVSGKIDKESILKKAIEKNDEKALEFLSWFEKKYDEEHQSLLPNFIMLTREFFNKYSKLPKIKMMIRTKDRFKDDILQEIELNLSNGKIASKDDLKIEVKRQMPVFLEICNNKRTKFHEPNIDETGITTSSCLSIEKFENIEISYAAEVYITMIKRLLTECRKKIKELVSWSG